MDKEIEHIIEEIIKCIGEIKREIVITLHNAKVVQIEKDEKDVLI